MLYGNPIAPVYLHPPSMYSYPETFLSTEKKKKKYYNKQKGRRGKKKTEKKKTYQKQI